MILKDIYLYPEVMDYGEELTYQFKDLTRSLCNYVGRKVKEAKCETNGFNRICFIGRKKPSGEPYINSSNVLGVDIFIDEVEYARITKDELNDYFSKLIAIGLVNIDDKYNVPKELICNAIDEFSKSGFVNEWVFKKKKINGRKFSVELYCRLTLDYFYLDFHVINDGRVVYEENILRECPDDFVFYYHLNTINVTEDNFVEVLDKPGNVIFSKSLESVLASE